MHFCPVNWFKSQSAYKTGVSCDVNVDFLSFLLPLFHVDLELLPLTRDFTFFIFAKKHCWKILGNIGQLIKALTYLEDWNIILVKILYMSLVFHLLSSNLLQCEFCFCSKDTVIKKQLSSLLYPKKVVENRLQRLNDGSLDTDSTGLPSVSDCTPLLTVYCFVYLFIWKYCQSQGGKLQKGKSTKIHTTS